jgi:uncharacterized protein YcgI (DUF1989 family)
MTKQLGSLISTDTIAPHNGFGGTLKTGQTLRIVDVEGEQVADFVSIKQGDPAEYLDCAYTNWTLGSWQWHEGNSIYTNNLNPIWTITHDRHGNHYTGGGYCSRPARQRVWGDDSRGCCETLQEVFENHGVDPNLLQAISCWNMFMTVDYKPDGGWEVGAAQNAPGDYLDIRAEMDLFWAVSVCAWPDQTNGFKPTPLRFEVYEASAQTP